MVSELCKVCTRCKQVLGPAVAFIETLAHTGTQFSWIKDMHSLTGQFESCFSFASPISDLLLEIYFVLSKLTLWDRVLLKQVVALMHEEFPTHGVCKSPPLLLVLSQMNPVHIFMRLRCRFFLYLLSSFFISFFVLISLSWFLLSFSSLLPCSSAFFLYFSFLCQFSSSFSDFCQTSSSFFAFTLPPFHISYSFPFSPSY
jgi:hypothetical protein